MMTNLMTILERKAFISSNPRIVLSSCPPPCGHFSIQESASGGLSYKVKNKVHFVFTNFKIKPIQKNLCFFFWIIYTFLKYISQESIYIPMNIHAIAKKQAKHEVLFQFLFYGLIPTNFLSSIYNIFHSTFSLVSY